AIPGREARGALPARPGPHPRCGGPRHGARELTDRLERLIMAVKEFAMPDLGEGLTESELVSWSIAVGDTIALNQVIAEVETAKALVQLPSPYAGTVSRLFVDEGTTVLVGAPIIAIEVEGDASAPEPVEGAPAE